MQDLIKIENRIINDDHIQTVDARELYEYLESKQEFSNWIKKRIEQYGFVENIDYIKVDKKIMDNNQQFTKVGDRIEYYISIDMAKEVSMVERNEKGKQARQYFILCEKLLLESRKNMKKSELYLLLAKEEEAKEKAFEEIKRLKPFEEKVVNSKVIFSKKEPVFDQEKGFKKHVQDVYPFLSNAHISAILAYYTTKRYKDTDHYIKSELDCVSTFFTEADMKVSPTKDTVTVKHPCLLSTKMRIRKDKAIEYLDYTEEDFE